MLTYPRLSKPRVGTGSAIKLENNDGLSKTVKALGRGMRCSTMRMQAYPSLSNAWVGICRFVQYFKRLCHDKDKTTKKITKDTMLVLSQNPVGVRGGGWLM